MFKENDVVKVELEKDRIKTIGTLTPTYSQGFSYPNGVKITNVKTKEGYAQQHGKITYETLDGNKYLALTSGGVYDSLFCTIASTPNLISASYVAWDFDSLEIAGTKDTTIVVEQKTVKDKDQVIKSKVDPTKDSVEVIKTKKITLPLLIDNLSADTMKLDGKDFVLVETVKSKKTTTADSTISDTLKTDGVETYPVLRSQVYKYYVIVRFPRDVWKADIQYFTGINQGNTVKYFGGVNVEEITYKMEEGPKKWDKTSHKINKVSVTFDSHGVTK